VPIVGWPANGSSATGVKMSKRRSVLGSESFTSWISDARNQSFELIALSIQSFGRK
jgi:hypothetical protein